MITQAYSVRDEAVEAFLPPFFCRARGEAIRSFQAAVNEPKGPFNANSQDFVLYYVGTFNDTNGEFVPCHPEKVMSGYDAQVPWLNRDEVSLGRPPSPDGAARS